MFQMINISEGLKKRKLNKTESNSSTITADPSPRPKESLSKTISASFSFRGSKTDLNVCQNQANQESKPAAPNGKAVDPEKAEKGKDPEVSSETEETMVHDCKNNHDYDVKKLEYDIKNMDYDQE